MSANIKNENTEHVDLTSILKDVENCIRSGLSNKLDTFFYEYDRYKKTHEEVLNLSIVRDLLKRGSSVISNVSEGTKPKLDPDLEMIVLRNQVIFLRGEVNKYKNQAEALALAHAEAPELEFEQESSQLNLEIKEKEPEPLDTKSEEQDNGDDGEEKDEDGDVLDNDDDDDEDGDGDVSETSSEGDGSDDDTGIANANTNTKYLPHIVEDNIQNIVLNVTEKDAEDMEAEEVEAEEVEAEEEAEEEEVVAEEEEAEEEEAEEEEEVVAEEEEAEEDEDDLPIKMPTFPTKTKSEPVVEVKPVIQEVKVEEEEEDEVETETEEDSDEEEETEPAPAPEPELKTSAPEKEEEEEEEEELYEVEINGVMYVTNDDEDGTIYSYDNEEVGDKVGEFKGLVAHIYKGKNKGIYDRTMCKMNF